jgi:phage antirepressor YoqD-like protein
MKTGLALTGAAHQTMSSKSISELTNKRHDNVKRTMEMLHQQGAISRPQIEDGIRSANGIVEKVYLVNKRDSFVVVAQVCPEFTAALVDRWQALEEQVRNPPAPVFTMPKDFSEALRQLADKNDEVIKIGFEKAAVESELEAVAPKVEAYDYLHDVVEGSMTISNAAKALQLHRNFLFEWLSKNGWTFRFGGVGEWVGHQGYIDDEMLDQRGELIPLNVGGVPKENRLVDLACWLTRRADHPATTAMGLERVRMTHSGRTAVTAWSGIAMMMRGSTGDRRWPSF